mmetsp:Transcript_8166/g.34123  ORF Transcript_8166/g.34123 Transcript_8166/m.34123 type:complete len:237 (+) Transcript_8166:1815-2525(+)
MLLYVRSSFLFWWSRRVGRFKYANGDGRDDALVVRVRPATKSPSREKSPERLHHLAHLLGVPLRQHLQPQRELLVVHGGVDGVQAAPGVVVVAHQAHNLARGEPRNGEPNQTRRLRETRVVAEKSRESRRERDGPRRRARERRPRRRRRGGVPQRRTDTSVPRLDHASFAPAEHLVHVRRPEQSVVLVDRKQNLVGPVSRGVADRAEDSKRGLRHRLRVASLLQALHSLRRERRQG